MLQFPVIGVWKPGEIHVAWTENSRKIIPDVEKLIEQAWLEAQSRPGIHLFDGPMCRLESIDARAGNMQLALSKSTYKPYVGTNMKNPQVADQYGDHVLANPVGLSALLISSDGHLLLGRRNASVAYYPGRVHPFAGCLEPANPLDIFDDVRRELREEASLDNSDIAELVCLGVVRDLALRQPEFIFAARAHRSLAQIESQLDHEEHLGIFHVPASQDSVESALISKEAFTPVGIASMLLWGRTQFGDTWLAQQSAKFRA